MNNCKHMTFEAHVKIGRLHDEETPNIIHTYMADIEVNCMECGISLVFIGVPGGVSFTEPAVSADGTQLRAPMQPENKPRRTGKDVN